MELSGLKLFCVSAEWTGTCAGTSNRYQYHCPEPEHREYQDQSGCAGNLGSRVLGAWWSQEGAGGNAAVSEVCF